MKSILFYRDFISYTGGHQKVADYFSHAKSSTGLQPHIAFSSRTVWDDSNPWHPEYKTKQFEYALLGYDYTFLAGMDWLAYLQAGGDFSKPIINLIQHVRHADPSEDVHLYLSYPAIRMCVSPEVESAIVSTGKVNGPVFTVPNGVCLPAVNTLQKKYDVIVLGIKQPEFARQIAAQCESNNMSVCLVDEKISRNALYAKMAASKIAVLLPHATEGFYLPALEAMQYCDVTIVPDCVGNRSFCKHNINCLMPEYNVEDIVSSVEKAAAIVANNRVLNTYREEAKRTLALHTLETERRNFLTIMNQVDNLWSGINYLSEIK